MYYSTEPVRTQNWGVFLTLTVAHPFSSRHQEEVEEEELQFPLVVGVVGVEFQFPQVVGVEGVEFQVLQVVEVEVEEESPVLQVGV